MNRRIRQPEPYVLSLESCSGTLMRNRTGLEFFDGDDSNDFCQKRDLSVFVLVYLFLSLRHFIPDI